MSKFSSFVSGSRSTFVVLGLWVVLVVALGPLAGKFESAQKNEPSSFLPGDAESVKVLNASDGFPSGQATPAIIVYSAPGGPRRREPRCRRRAPLGDRRRRDRGRHHCDRAGGR